MKFRFIAALALLAALAQPVAAQNEALWAGYDRVAGTHVATAPRVSTQDRYASSRTSRCQGGYVALVNAEALPVVVALSNLDLKAGEKVAKAMRLKKGSEWRQGSFTEGNDSREAVLILIPGYSIRCAPFLGEQWNPIRYSATAFQGVGDMANSADPVGDALAYGRTPWSVYDKQGGRWIFTLTPKAIK